MIVGKNFEERVEKSGRNHALMVGAAFSEADSSCKECIDMIPKLEHIVMQSDPEDNLVRWIELCMRLAHER